MGSEGSSEKVAWHFSLVNRDGDPLGLLLSGLSCHNTALSLLGLCLQTARGRGLLTHR